MAWTHSGWDRRAYVIVPAASATGAVRREATTAAGLTAAANDSHGAGDALSPVQPISAVAASHVGQG